MFSNNIMSSKNNPPSQVGYNIVGISNVNNGTNAILSVADNRNTYTDPIVTYPLVVNSKGIQYLVNGDPAHGPINQTVYNEYIGNREIMTYRTLDHVGATTPVNFICDGFRVNGNEIANLTDITQIDQAIQVPQVNTLTTPSIVIANSGAVDIYDPLSVNSASGLTIKNGLHSAILAVTNGGDFSITGANKYSIDGGSFRSAGDVYVGNNLVGLQAQINALAPGGSSQYAQLLFSNPAFPISCTASVDFPAILYWGGQSYINSTDLITSGYTYIQNTTGSSMQVKVEANVTVSSDQIAVGGLIFLADGEGSSIGATTYMYYPNKPYNLSFSKIMTLASMQNIACYMSSDVVAAFTITGGSFIVTKL